jgi:hypothetical protein
VEDASHRLGRGCKEMAAILEVLIADKPEMSFVHQRGRIQRVIGPLGGHSGGRELT